MMNVVRGDARVGLMFVMCVFVSVVVGIVFSSEARAADIVVTSNADSGTGTLRAAIDTANSNGQNDTITFDLPQGQRTITLTSGELVSSQGTTVIDGDDLITVSGNDASRIFSVTGGEATFRDITLTRGRVNVPGANSGGALYVSSGAIAKVESSTVSNNSAASRGGGILNEGGMLTVTSSIISGNSASNNGGGILNDFGTLMVVSSTISNNSAGAGGGIYSFTETYFASGEGVTKPATHTMVTNSTIEGNSASTGGSGVFNNNGYTEINYSTITNNSSTDSTTFGVHSFGNSTTGTRLTGSIVVGNTAADQPSDVGNSNSNTRPFESGGGNVTGQGRASDFPDSRGNRTGVTVAQAFGTSSPTLADNGGPTQTVALVPGSVSINRIPASTTGVPATDQRTVARLQFSASDSGSYEYNGSAPTITLSPQTLPRVDEGDSYSQQLSASGSNGQYTFAIRRGRLPEGLTLSESGLISGTLAEGAETDAFTVTATDGSGFTGDEQYLLRVVDVNDPPTFTLGQNQTVAEDSPPQTVSNFVTNVDDVDADEDQTVTFTTTNDNNALFAANGQPAISQNGTLTYTPAPNGAGSATVTVTAKDNGGTVNGGDDTSEARTFVIAVTNSNDVPTISQISSQTIKVNGSTPQIRFTVSDPDDAATSLTVSAKSSNTKLVKPGGIKLAGTGANRTVRVTPVKNQTGRATITLTVTDPAGLKATRTFTVIVKK